jgi:hypothetical protein
LIFGLVCAGLAWLVLAQGGAPEQMVALARRLWLLIVVILGITLTLWTRPSPVRCLG